MHVRTSDVDDGPQRHSGPFANERSVLDRYRVINRVLTKHGLGALTAAAGVDRFLPARRGDGPVRERPDEAAHLRMALEELGPVFIKLGQALSTRGDLLPERYIVELATLREHAPAVDEQVIRATIRSELGSAPEELFAEFDPVPLASASIGQAHAAVRHDGIRVVVKVRRPGVAQLIDDDLSILLQLADRASRAWTAAADFDVSGVVRRFADTLRAELDYREEATNAERFATAFAHDPDIHIPRVFRETSTGQVLTLERVEGTSIGDLARLDELHIDRVAVIDTAIDAIVKMVFTDGFFHGDPHPGNLFVQADGTISLIDFGMVGRIDVELRPRLLGLFHALSTEDVGRVANALVRLCGHRAPLDLDALRVDVARFVALYRGLALGDAKLAPLITALLGLLQRHRLQLPADVVMLTRVLVMVEGIGSVLDPGFALGAALRTRATALTAAQTSPRALLAQARSTAEQLVALGIELPDTVRRIVDDLDANGLEVHLRVAELNPIIDRLERLGSRLVAGMVASALIGGISRLATTPLVGRWTSANGGLLGAMAGRGSAAAARRPLRYRVQDPVRGAGGMRRS